MIAPICTGHTGDMVNILQQADTPSRIYGSNTQQPCIYRIDTNVRCGVGTYSCFQIENEQYETLFPLEPKIKTVKPLTHGGLALRAEIVPDPLDRFEQVEQP